ncbi:MAG TPA: alpha/beta hydrolase [Polyangiaceae bacterium]|nr:alpha/beta hydrolase [Polyangiaceae bacterium]
MARTTVDGCELHYEVTGRGEPVLLLHGLGSCSLDWERQKPALEERYTVITLDVRGHGQSAKPRGPYSIGLFAQDAAHLLQKLALGPAHVIGISMGGMIAFQLAVDAPRLVRTLTVVNSAPAVVPKTLSQWLTLRLRLWLPRLFGLRWLARRIAAVNFPRPEQEADRRLLAERLASNDPAAYRAATKAIIGWSVAERIRDIRCPALVVSGDRDYTPVALKESYATLMHDARVAVIADSRHVTTHDQPAALNRVLLDFLAEHRMANALPEARAAGSA